MDDRGVHRLDLEKNSGVHNPNLLTRRNLGLNSATTTDEAAGTKEDLKLLQHLHCCPGFFCLLSELLLALGAPSL